MLESRKLFLVSLPFALKFLCNFLLEDKGLESIVTLLLSSRKTSSEASGVILLLVNKTGKTSVLALVILNLDLKILSLFGELLCESLEFEEL